MLRLLACLSACYIPFSGFVQQNTFEARYKVSTDIYSVAKEKILTLDYNGLLYNKGDRYISYKKPLYLAEYPTGYADIIPGDDNTGNISVYMDTLQGIRYADMDSLVLRTRSDGTGKGFTGQNSYFTFERGSRDWQYLDETRVINGLSCQKARIYARGEIIMEVWFCPDIPMEAGPCGIIELPGLVVELDIPVLHEKWTLQSYTSGIAISDELFWPEEFNQAFTYRNHIQKQTGATARERSNSEKLREISNQ